MSPLRIQVLFHWESAKARHLAQQLYATFSARPTGGGPRIPVRYGHKRPDGGPPERLELTAEHEILVLLIDERMARRARPTDKLVADAWGQFAADLVTAHGPKRGSPHRVLLVALDPAALGLTDALSDRSFVRLDYRTESEGLRHLTLHVAVAALLLLQDRPAEPNQPTDKLPEAPVQLFISHAKGDLSRDPAALAEGPVRAILATQAQLPVDGWFDAKKIPPGGRFDKEIEKGVLNSSALIAVLTDNWSAREWCRREVLEAKMAGRPMIVVDALEARVVRLFPYIGNAPTIRWRAAIASPSDASKDSWLPQRWQWEAEDAALAIETALLEALRYLHDHERLKSSVGEHEVALGTSPEALTLAHLPHGTRRVWYPDPPLGQEELERLNPATGEGAAHQLELTTPLRELARWPQPPGVKPIAVSLSGAPDDEAYGGSPEHLATFADDLVLYLLVAGLRVAYGGVLGHAALTDGKIQGDDINYVDRLLAMARSHSTLIKDIRGAKLAPIENWVAWPIYHGFGDAEYRVYGQEAELKDRPAPPDLAVGPDELQPEATGFFAPNTPARRYAWARSLTYMRESMQAGTAARILMGGKLTGFKGLWPGVLEEGVIALRARQPLYPLGVFGGAARLMIDILQAKERKELTTAWLKANVKEWEELQAEYQRRGPAVSTPEALAAEIRQVGANGLAKALNNGLTDDENQELVVSDDPQRVVALILEGLRQKLGS